MYNSELEEKEIRLDNLFLDPNNPRFTDASATTSDKRTVEEKVQQNTYIKIFREGVEELVGSILYNGFLPLDRIVVRELDGLPGQYVVVEGNRRLAALRTVRDRITGAELDETEFPEARQGELLSSIESIHCLVYTGAAKIDIAWILQGIRHISGIRDWSPAQRAELVAKEIDGNRLKPRQVGQMLGISTQQVNRLYRANRGLSQMLADDDYANRAQKDYFTLFEEAYQKKNVREWLGWDSTTEIFTKLDNLHHFYELISPDSSHNDDRRLHDPRQMSALDRILGAERLDLLVQVLEYELNIEEAKGRLDESEKKSNWKEQIEQAAKALDSMPATTIATQPSEVLAALHKLQSVVDQLVNAASLSKSQIVADTSAEV